MNEANPFLALKFRNLLLWVFVWSMIGTVLVLILFSAIGDTDDPRATSLTLIIPYAAAIWWLHRSLRRHGLRIRGFLAGREYSTPRVVTIAPLLILLAIGSVWLVYQPLSRVFPDWVRERMASMDWVIRAPDQPHATITNLLNFLAIVILAPIAEELVFRGFLFQRWSAKYGLMTGMIASSLLFGLLHIDLVGKVVFALVLCVIYLRTGSLIEPIIIHMLNNLIAMLSGLYTIYRPGQFADRLTEITESGWAGVMLAISLPPLLVFLRRNWPLPGAQLPRLAPAADLQPPALVDPDITREAS